MIPWFDRPIIYDVRARPHVVESTSGSRDLQMVYFAVNELILLFVDIALCLFKMLGMRYMQVKIGLRVLTRPESDMLPTIYRSLGTNYNERVLPSIIHETLKAVVAQYNASQLITQREVSPLCLFIFLTSQLALIYIQSLLNPSGLGYYLVQGIFNEYISL
jgi:prohibitin 2